MSKVYLVIFNGYMEDYGSYSYLLGAYDTKDKAEEAVKTLPADIRDDDEFGDYRVAIHEIEINKTYEIQKDEWGDYSTEWPTGGYAE
jgi:hypothetical protein